MLDSKVECGHLWAPCHSARQLRRMRDSQIEDILRRENNQTKYDHCSLLIEYRYLV